MKKMKLKEPKVLKDIDRQIGTTFIPKDLKLSALRPGKRMSKSGNVYWETRKNRSDRKGKRV